MSFQCMEDRARQESSSLTTWLSTSLFSFHRFFSCHNAIMNATLEWVNFIVQYYCTTHKKVLWTTQSVLRLWVLQKPRPWKKNMAVSALEDHKYLQKILPTCSRPAVSPTGFKWFFKRSWGVIEECRANMIMANSGTLSAQVLAACKSSAATSMCSLTASHRRTSRSGSLLTRDSTTHSRFSQPIRFTTCHQEPCLELPHISFKTIHMKLFLTWMKFNLKISKL